MKKYEIYTDGATSKNGYEGSIGGWGWVIYDSERNIVVEEGNGACVDTTNNQCELTAMIEACGVARKYMNDDDFAVVYSDSAYIINCYKEKWYYKWQENGWVNVKKAPIANQIDWKLLIFFFEDSRFDFRKVRGHSGIEGNERADELAVNARRALELELKAPCYMPEGE